MSGCKPLQTSEKGGCRSDTRSMCTARMTQQVNRQIQTLELLPLPVTLNNGPAKSTPVELNGESLLTQKSDSSGGIGASYVLPSNLLHTRHLQRTCLTSDLPLGTQYIPCLNLCKDLLYTNVENTHMCFEH